MVMMLGSGLRISERRVNQKVVEGLERKGSAPINDPSQLRKHERRPQQRDDELDGRFCPRERV